MTPANELPSRVLVVIAVFPDGHSVQHSSLRTGHESRLDLGETRLLVEACAPGSNDHWTVHVVGADGVQRTWRSDQGGRCLELGGVCLFFQLDTEIPGWNCVPESGDAEGGAALTVEPATIHFSTDAKISIKPKRTPN